MLRDMKRYGDDSSIIPLEVVKNYAFDIETNTVIVDDTLENRLIYPSATPIQDERGGDKLVTSIDVYSVQMIPYEKTFYKISDNILNDAFENFTNFNSFDEMVEDLFTNKTPNTISLYGHNTNRYDSIFLLSYLINNYIEVRHGYTSTLHMRGEKLDMTMDMLKEYTRLTKRDYLNFGISGFKAYQFLDNLKPKYYIEILTTYYYTTKGQLKINGDLKFVITNIETRERKTITVVDTFGTYFQGSLSNALDTLSPSGVGKLKIDGKMSEQDIEKYNSLFEDILTDNNWQFTNEDEFDGYLRPEGYRINAARNTIEYLYNFVDVYAVILLLERYGLKYRKNSEIFKTALEMYPTEELISSIEFDYQQYPIDELSHKNGVLINLALGWQDCYTTEESHIAHYFGRIHYMQQPRKPIQHETYKKWVGDVDHSQKLQLDVLKYNHTIYENTYTRSNSRGALINVSKAITDGVVRDNVVGVDIKSSYPNIYTNYPLPVGADELVEVEWVDNPMEMLHRLSDLYFTSKTPIFINSIIIGGEFNLKNANALEIPFVGGNITDDGWISTTLTIHNTDIPQILSLYDVRKLRVEKIPLYGMFCDYILKPYGETAYQEKDMADRAIAKGEDVEKNETKRYEAKIKLNSLFGMFATRHYFPNPGQVSLYTTRDSKMSIASCILSLGRHVLISGMSKLSQAGCKVLYSHTDSLHFNMPPGYGVDKQDVEQFMKELGIPTGEELGQFAYERVSSHELLIGRAVAFRSNEDGVFVGGAIKGYSDKSLKGKSLIEISKLKLVDSPIKTSWMGLPIIGAYAYKKIEVISEEKFNQ